MAIGNRYSFSLNSENFILVPLSPNKVFEDQKKIKNSLEAKSGGGEKMFIN